MDPIERLTEYFTRFPGVGIRQARRFVYHLLHKEPGYRKALASLILEVESAISRCEVCQRFTADNLIAGACTICRNPARAASLLIVEKDADLERIEKSSAYRGRYFVLGGIVPMTADDPKEYVRFDPLLAVIKKGGATLQEVIFGLSITPDGEHTTDLLHEPVERLLQGTSTKVTRLGRGLSTGSELEYADTATIENALKTRG